MDELPTLNLDDVDSVIFADETAAQVKAVIAVTNKYIRGVWL